LVFPPFGDYVENSVRARYMYILWCCEARTLDEMSTRSVSHVTLVFPPLGNYVRVHH
jgi:hypothetical protein